MIIYDFTSKSKLPRINYFKSKSKIVIMRPNQCLESKAGWKGSCFDEAEQPAVAEQISVSFLFLVINLVDRERECKT